MIKPVLTQLTLRIKPDVIDTLKLRAKQESTSVNTLVSVFIENELSNQESGTLFKLTSEPVSTLARIHKKIADTFNSGKSEPLQSEEIRFIASGAIKRLDSTPLAGPFYEGVRARAARLSPDAGRDELQLIFGFALRHYLRDLDERMQFAIQNAPDDIDTKQYALSVSDMLFTFGIDGNELNKCVDQEIQRPPKLTMRFESYPVDIQFTWDTFSAFARIMYAVNNSDPLESLTGAEALLTPDRKRVGGWLLYLNKAQVRISGGELLELAEKFNDFMESDAGWTLQQLRLVYGE